MQRRYFVFILALALMSGIAVAALPRVKADYPTGVHIYVDPHIIPPTASVPAPLIVKVSIDSPAAWDNTADGIVGWAMSVRVDPRVLQVYGVRKAQPDIAHLPSGGTPAGFLENFLVRNGHTWFDPFFLEWNGYTTSWYNPADVDTITGTMLDFSEQIEAYGTLGKGAGGGPYPLCELMFMAQSNTDPSVIDLFGPPRPPIIEIEPMYLTVDGTWHSADVVDDGYYIGETPDITYFEMESTASVIGSLWHEVWPEFCREWRIDSHEDTDADGLLDPSEQIDFTRLVDEYKAWYHVEWVNPEPVAGDGKADLIVKFKEEVPEFPLGFEYALGIALAATVVYIWWMKRRKLRVVP